MSDAGGPGCHWERVALTPPEIDLVFVVDGSASMLEPLESGTDVARHEVLGRAISEMVAGLDRRINTGLVFFLGDGDRCDIPSAPQVAIAPQAADAIAQAFAMHAPMGRSPIGAGLWAGVDALEDRRELGRTQMMVLISDGLSNCGDSYRARTALRRLDGTIDTFVLGLAPPGPVHFYLNQLAGIGDRPRIPSDDADTRRYYNADIEAELHDVLAQIAHAVSWCTYPVRLARANSDDIDVFVDGERIPRRYDTNSWSWSERPDENDVGEIVLFEGACAGVDATSLIEVLACVP